MARLSTLLLFVAVLTACGSTDSDAPPVIRGVSYVGMSVSDIDQATQYYVSAANMTSVGRSQWSSSNALDELTGSRNASAETVLLQSTNAQLRLMQFAHSSPASTPPVSPQGPGITHVCYQAAQETRTYQNFMQSGATPVGVPQLVQLTPKRPVWYAYARDADGIMFEVEHVDVAALELPEPPKHDHRLRHVALATPDMGRIVDFYKVLLQDDDPRRIGRLFGGISGEKLDQISGLSDVKITMSWFQPSNLELEIGQYSSHPTTIPEEPRPLEALGYNMIVFDVTNLTDARALLLEAGGAIVTEPEARDGGELFFGRDPDGNLLGFQTTEPGSLVSSEQFEVLKL